MTPANPERLREKRKKLAQLQRQNYIDSFVSEYYRIAMRKIQAQQNSMSARTYQTASEPKNERQKSWWDDFVGIMK